MVHIKWLIALVLAVAVSVYASIFFTEKYVNEIGIGQVSEITIINNKAYASMIKSMDEGSCGEAKTKLEKLRLIEIHQIQYFKSLLENGYFRNLSSEAIDRMNRYLSSIGSKSGS